MNIDSFSSLNMVQFCQVVGFFLHVHVRSLYCVALIHFCATPSVICDSGLIKFTLHVHCTVLCIHLFHLKLACEYVRQSVPGRS